MARLLKYFFRGLVVLAPLVITVWLTFEIFRRVDRWLGGLFGFTIPGAGVLLTIALITLFGFLASNLLARTLLGALDAILARLPFVRLLYGSTRDLLNAFVGERRRFDTPVLVTLSSASNLKTIGFVTQESLERYGLRDYVAVYLPQSYNFAGNLVIVPAAQVERIRARGADVMAFIVSGGVTGGAAPGTEGKTLAATESRPAELPE